ncbi:hypothetical protein OFEAOIEE_LOCUS3720 [Methylorubrum extorquens]
MILFAVVAFVLTASPASAAAETTTGRASDGDGDTLDIQGQRFRLHGTDAPESGQACQDARKREYRCGKNAALALTDKIGRGAVVCERKATHKYSRSLRSAGSTISTSMAGSLVEQGLALAYPCYSEAYVPQEDAAKSAKRGIWAVAFTAPWEWRKVSGRWTWGWPRLADRMALSHRRSHRRLQPPAHAPSRATFRARRPNLPPAWYARLRAYADRRCFGRAHVLLGGWCESSRLAGAARMTVA